jgi:hypothetical protein
MKKIINFFAKSFEQIRLAYIMLKERYKKPITLKTISIGAGLYRGYFCVLNGL